MIIYIQRITYSRSKIKILSVFLRINGKSIVSLIMFIYPIHHFLAPFFIIKIHFFNIFCFNRRKSHR